MLQRGQLVVRAPEVAADSVRRAHKRGQPVVEAVEVAAERIRTINLEVWSGLCWKCPGFPAPEENRPPVSCIEHPRGRPDCRRLSIFRQATLSWALSCATVTPPDPFELPSHLLVCRCSVHVNLRVSQIAPV